MSPITNINQKNNFLDLPGVEFSDDKKGELAQNLLKIDELKNYLQEEKKKIESKLSEKERIDRCDVYYGDIKKGIQLLIKTYPKIKPMLKDIGYETFSLTRKKLFERQYLEELALLLLEKEKNYSTNTFHIRDQPLYFHLDNYTKETRSKMDSADATSFGKCGLGYVPTKDWEVLAPGFKGKKSIDLESNALFALGEKKWKMFADNIQETQALELEGSDLYQLSPAEWKIIMTGCKGLKRFSLNGNGLGEMQEYKDEKEQQVIIKIRINGLKNIRTLQIAENNLNEWSESAWKLLTSGLPELRAIDLSENYLGRMEKPAFTLLITWLKKRKFVDISGNNLEDRQEGMIQKELIDKGVNVHIDKKS